MPAPSRIQKKLKTKLDLYQRKIEEFNAFTGDRNGVVVVPDRAGFIYVLDFAGVLHEVLNNVAPIDHPREVVKCRREGGVLRVVSMLNPYSQVTYGNVSINTGDLTWPGSSTIWVRGEQFIPGLPIVDPDNPMTVAIYPIYIRTIDGVYQFIPYTEIDMTAYVPATGACWALISFAPDGTLVVTTTTTGGSLAAVLNTPIDVYPDPSYWSVAAIALYAGMTEITSDATANLVADLRWSNGAESTTGAEINAAAADIPLDADKFGFWDVVDSALKSVTWTNIKSTLKTYFDTLYSALGHVHAASAITNTPAGGIASTDVQAAINELDGEKSPTSHTHAGVIAGIVMETGVTFPPVPLTNAEGTDWIYANP